MTKQWLGFLFGGLGLLGCASIPESLESTATAVPTTAAQADPQATPQEAKAENTQTATAATASRKTASAEQVIIDHLGRKVGIDTRPPSTALPPYPLTQRQVHPAVVSAQHRRIFPEPDWRYPKPAEAVPKRTQLMPQGSGDPQLCQAFYDRVTADVWIGEGSWTDWILYGGDSNGLKSVKLKVPKKLPLSPVAFWLSFVDLDHNGVYELLHFVDRNLSSQMMHQNLYLLGEASAEEVEIVLGQKDYLPLPPHGPPYSKEEQEMIGRNTRKVWDEQDRVQNAIADRLLARYNRPEARAVSKGLFSFVEDPSSYLLDSREELVIPYLDLLGSEPMRDLYEDRFALWRIQLEGHHYLMVLNRTRKQAFLVGLDTQTRIQGGYSGYPFKLLCRVDFFRQ